MVGVRLPFMMVSLPTFLQGRHGLALCRPQSATVCVDIRRVWAADFSIDLEVTWWRWCLRRLGHGGSQFWFNSTAVWTLWLEEAIGSAIFAAVVAAGASLASAMCVQGQSFGCWILAWLFHLYRCTRPAGAFCFLLYLLRWLVDDASLHYGPVPLHICEWAWSSWFILALLVVPLCHRFAPHWHWAAEWLSAWPLALAVHGAVSVWGRLHLTKFFFFFRYLKYGQLWGWFPEFQAWFQASVTTFF